MEGGTARGELGEFQDRLIAAYTQRYHEAAVWKTIIWLGSAALFVAALVIAAFDGGAAALGLVGSGYLLCSRLVLRPEMTRGHREGVAIQEQYDVDAFGLPWNKSLGGKALSPMDVEALAERFSGDPSSLADWYVAAEGAPPGAQVLLRQLENAWWGRRDHRRFAVFSTVSLVLSVGATILVGLGRDVSLATYVSSLIAPSLPWLLDLADLSVLHWRAAAARDDLESDLIACWNALGPEGPDVPLERLRENQDRIFIARRRFGRVPTWFYRLSSDSNEKAFRSAADRMLTEKGWRQ